MNRVEYMTRLAELLRDIPAEERQEAMKYYSDYFDEAGEENEEKIAGELDSPEKVAAAIKADLYGTAGEAGEYRETGYTDTRFEQKDSPIEYGDYPQKKGAPRTNKLLKILLILAIIIVGMPIVFGVAAPMLLAVLAVILAVVFSGFILLACGVLAAVCMMVGGIAVFIAGLIQIPGSAAVAFALIGGGMLVFSLGMVGTVLLVKLCMMLFPAMFRGIVNICRRPFHRKAVS